VGVPNTTNLVIYNGVSQPITLKFIAPPAGGVGSWAGIQCDFMATPNGPALTSLSTLSGTLTLTDATLGIWIGTLTSAQTALLVNDIGNDTLARRVYMRVYRLDASPSNWALATANANVGAFMPQAA